MFIRVNDNDFVSANSIVHVAATGDATCEIFLSDGHLVKGECSADEVLAACGGEQVLVNQSAPVQPARAARR